LFFHAKNAALAQQGVNQRCLTVIDMGNNGNVTDVASPRRIRLQHDPHKNKKGPKKPALCKVGVPILPNL
jgi:hypothetical protein